MFDVESEDDIALEMLQAIEAERDDLQAQLRQKNQEIHALNQKLEVTENNLRKAKAAKNKTAAQQQSGVYLKMNAVSEYYDGEIRYFIIEALKTHRLYGHHKRYTQLVDDLKQQNMEVLQQVEQDLQDLRAVLVGYKGPTPQVMEALGKFGIELFENNKHIKARFANDHQYMVTLGKSASDHKAGINNFKYFTDNLLPKFN
ncbi:MULTISPECIES: hypothetical protein [Vitreoscilla]|uniref:Uncharacterized protein n=1 Tax=Vitreoscilla stercoraria TaxID=61 RepID=A0ABY4EEQ1_VITST|nr:MULTISPECIES: hypothetical protein [Vitreoscilla]AUZ04124.1 hypothetical protein ADP71_03110 [Vitreoscilla sp. C1]UOO93183.1 hypothetical protein LVJ81_03885 [Vitreoscilla stercoraria]